MVKHMLDIYDLLKKQISQARVTIWVFCFSNCLASPWKNHNQMNQQSAFCRAGSFPLYLEAEITIQKKKGQFSTHWKTTKKNELHPNKFAINHRKGSALFLFWFSFLKMIGNQVTAMLIRIPWHNVWPFEVIFESSSIFTTKKWPQCKCDHWNRTFPYN